ncbi:F-box only protein 28 [Culicoides brevitarsis]|uniref:F-box only protein 28 n=1 Tax=Culicoides brevitarsis TaxID=469753 RepID=UPI00307BEF7E
MVHLLDLPDLCLEHIFSFLTYDEIAKKRIICKRINELNQGILNRGFHMMIKRHAANMKAIKAQLPRRESERRNHPLSKHSDIMTCIETRISMLSMTYTKYMDLDLCCFIPGRVIDEVLNILRVVEQTSQTKTTLRAHEVLQELRDISSMATDHFDDEIAPVLKKRYLNQSNISTPIRDRSFSSSYSFDRSVSEKLIGVQDTSTTSNTSTRSSPACEDHVGCNVAQSTRNAVVKLQNSYKIALRKARAMVQIQTKHMLEMKSYSLEVSNLKSTVNDLKKRLEEYEVKNREMSATIIQLKAERQLANASNLATSPESPRRTGNIKPRQATIILKRRIEEPSHASDSLETLKKSRTHQ